MSIPRNVIPTYKYLPALTFWPPNPGKWRLNGHLQPICLAVLCSHRWQGFYQFSELFWSRLMHTLECGYTWMCQWDLPWNSGLQDPAAEGRAKCGVQQWFPVLCIKKWDGTRVKEMGENPEAVEDTDTQQRKRIQSELLSAAFSFEFYFFHA